jgi:hypothetical protein
VHANARAQAPESLADDQCAGGGTRYYPMQSTYEERMTTTFDKREEGFENQFAHDEELRFKAIARRNKMLGLWAAGLLGKSGADAEAFAKDVLLAEFDEGGDEVIVRKLVMDLAGKTSEQQIRNQMNTLLAQAVAQVKQTG